MVYIMLNIAAVLLLAMLARQVDRLNVGTGMLGGIVVSILLLIVESVLLSITLIFRQIWAETMVKLALKVAFMVESAFLISLFYGLIELGLTKRNIVFFFLKFFSYIGAIVFVYMKFRTFEFSDGIFVPCDYLFNGEAREVFPWTWYSVYNIVFRLVLPSIGCFVMLILREKKTTPLLNYQSVLLVGSIGVLWALMLFMSYMTRITPTFSLLYIYAYVVFLVLVYTALRKTTVPSGRGMFFNIIRGITAYLLPAAFLGVMLNFVKPIDRPGFGMFEMAVIAFSVIAVLFAWKAWDFTMSSSRSASSNYEANFEKDLANVDYSGEMETVTGRMFDVFKNNVECSSMNILVDDGHGVFTPAFSSNNTTFSISLNNTFVFDVLLNINRNVVIFSEIDDDHEFDGIRDSLKELFTTGNFDAMFILNEGHSIVGVITLGMKISGDHYNTYDKSMFVKFYSYFFVFGYYIRNISNKEVLGTVNREIMMSAQIITSIQENIDQIKSHKVDIGYLMVPAHNIGGEFIDLIRLTNSRHLIVVGDLSGKGIAASMNMVILKSIIRTYLAETHDFKQLVAKINVFIKTSLKKGTIFAGLFALLDFDTDTMYYINCGIPSLCMYTRVYNNVIEIQGSGNILGFVKDITPYLSVKTTKLNRGDIILACTDGLINSHSLRGEKFGKERVTQALLDNSSYPAQRMAQFTFDGLRKFMSKDMEDDVSILVMKYKTSAEFASPEEIAAEKAAEEAARKRLEEERELYKTAEETEEETEPKEDLMEGFLVRPFVPTDFLAENAAVLASAEESGKIADSVVSGESTPEEALVSESSDSIVDEAQTIAENPIGNEPTEDVAASVEEGSFGENTSNEPPKVENTPAEAQNDVAFDFDPSAFGLPDDFTL